MSGSNCCFFTCIHIFQKAVKVVLYSHLLKNFPQFVVIHTVRGFSIVSKAEVDVFLELPCFFYDPMDIGNSISGPSAFSKSNFKTAIRSLLYCSHFFLSYFLVSGSDFNFSVLQHTDLPGLLYHLVHSWFLLEFLFQLLYSSSLSGSFYFLTLLITSNFLLCASLLLSNSSIISIIITVNSVDSGRFLPE